jgi:hypothetical protein
VILTDNGYGNPFDISKLLDFKEVIMRKNIDEIDAEKIIFLNQRLGMSHRTKPYNLNNVEDVKTLLKLSVGRYLDYFKYWNDLQEIDELFDESIEYFDTETWVNLSNTSPKGNELILNAISSFDKTIESFRILMESAESECKELIGQALRMEKDIRKEIFGNILEYDEAIIDEIFMDIHELEYQYNMEEAFDMFIKYINEKFIEKSSGRLQ